MGVIGAFVSLVVSADEAVEILYTEGMDAAKQHMIEWAVSAAGGFAGGTISYGVGTIVLGLAGAAGATVSAPLAGAILFGASLIGGIYGEDIAKQIHELWEDMDGNGHKDFIDRFSTALFGQEIKFEKIPEIFKSSAIHLRAEMPLADLIAKVKEDIAYRYALRELNPFVAEGADYTDFNTDGSLNLWDINLPTENINGMTEDYIRDRSQMVILQMRYLKNNLNLTHDLVDDIVQGDWDYYDLGIHPFAGNRDRPIELSIDGNGIMTDNHRVIFGTDNNPKGEEVLEGGGRADRLYGRGGNDTLKGGTGNDYMEGGTGHDAYYIQDHDTILDTDGKGTLLFTGKATGEVAGKFVLQNPQEKDAQKHLWQSVDTDGRADGKLSAYRHDDALIIKENGTNNQATINHFFTLSDNGRKSFLGITLAEGEPPATAQGNIAHSGRQNQGNVYYLGTESFDITGGNRHDFIIGRAAKATQDKFALVARTGAGSDLVYGSFERDWIEGGDDTDVLNGSAFTPKHLDTRDEKAKALDKDTIFGGAKGDFINGMAGDDTLYGDDDKAHLLAEQSGERGDWITGGEGNDQIYGSAGQDFLQGGENTDVIHGGAGGKAIYIRRNRSLYLKKSSFITRFSPLHNINPPNNTRSQPSAHGNISLS